MKILHINNTYKNIGGAETYINSLIKKQTRKGHKIYQFAIDDEVEIISDKLFVYKDKYKRGALKYFLWFYFNPFLFIKLSKWIERVNPDVIHIHNNGKFESTILFYLLKNKKNSIIQTVHDFSILCPISTYICNNNKVCHGRFGLMCYKNRCIPWFVFIYELLPSIIIRILRKKVIHSFISPSKILRHDLEKHHYSNVIYLPNFVDYYPIPSLQYQHGKLLFVGRLTVDKGIFHLIRAFPLILKRFPYCRLEIVGHGPQLYEIKELITKLNLHSKVFLHGKISDIDLRKLYIKSQIVIIPSIWCENNPLVLLEAMEFGKSIVGSNIGGIPDLIIHRETGLLFEPGNLLDLIEKISEFLLNPQFGDRLGRNAHDFVFKYCNGETHYCQLIEIYEKNKI